MIYLHGKKSRTEQRNVGESIVYVEGYHMTLKSMTWYNPYVGGSISYVGGNRHLFYNVGGNSVYVMNRRGV